VLISSITALANIAYARYLSLWLIVSTIQLFRECRPLETTRKGIFINSLSRVLRYGSTASAVSFIWDPFYMFKNIIPAGNGKPLLFA